MKGLLMKDFCLLLQRKRYLLLVSVCGVITGISTGLSFFVGWLTLIISLFTLSTITYDEYDNCYPFLMSLPASRAQYALEKYLFGALCSVAAWVFAVVTGLVAVRISGTMPDLWEELTACLGLLPIPFLILAVNLPLNLKYGSERGRTMLIIIFGVIAACAFLLAKTASVDFTALPMHALAGLALAVLTAVLFAGSALLSIRIMQKKEF